MRFSPKGGIVLVLLRIRNENSFRVWVARAAELHADRDAGEAEGFAQAVDQVAAVVLRHLGGAGAEHDEGRGTGLRLRDVAQLQAPAVDQRRRVALECG